jgi:uncharacterized protein (TIGR03437 family)
MRTTAVLLVLALIAGAQIIPIRLGDPINLIPPATNADGNGVLFAAGVSPDGTVQQATNLYLFMEGRVAASVRQLTNYAGSSTLTGVTSVSFSASSGVAGFATLPAGPGGAEEVHLIDTASAADRTLVTDKQGCIQPLCVSCFRACVGPVHVTDDGSRVLFAVARQKPFFVVNADGTGLNGLPIYQGSLAPSPQRVISRAGNVVFTSSAPSGPTFAAAATDAYTINLDSTGLRQVTRFGDPMFFASNAAISADGSLIAFESNFSNSGPQTVQVWVVRPDGTGLRMVSTGPDSAGSPTISGDGSVVTFLQSGQIMRTRTDGDTTPLALTKLSFSAPRDPVVSEDGAQVAFTLGPPSGSPAAVHRIPTDSTTDLRGFGSVYAPRMLNQNGVATAAGYGSPSAGSLISVYGANLVLDELSQASEFPLPPVLNGLSLLVNGQPVPLLAITPWQINAHLPQTVPPGVATFQLRYTGFPQSPLVSAEVRSFSPANFAFPFTRGRLYYSQAAAFHAGTGVAADMDNPAVAGEILEIYGLGLGVTVPAVDAGVPSPASPPAVASHMPRVQIGGRDAVITFAGLAPGLAGVYQVNAIVPGGLSPGLQSLAWIGVDGLLSYSSIAVK